MNDSVDGNTMRKCYIMRIIPHCILPNCSQTNKTSSIHKKILYRRLNSLPFTFNLKIMIFFIFFWIANNDNKRIYRTWIHFKEILPQHLWFSRFYILKIAFFFHLLFFFKRWKTFHRCVAGRKIETLKVYKCSM